MKYSCHHIMDLLPLYYDGVLSEDSVRIVEEHFEECPSCKAYFETMKVAEAEPISMDEAEIEHRKYLSFRELKKSFFKKQVLGVLTILFGLTALCCLSFFILKNIEVILSPSDPIHVTEGISNLILYNISDETSEESQNKSFVPEEIIVQGNQPILESNVDIESQCLYARVRGISIDHKCIHTMTRKENGKEKTYLFFTLYSSKWDQTFRDDFDYYTALTHTEAETKKVDYVYYTNKPFDPVNVEDLVDFDELLDHSELMYSRVSKG